MIRIAHDRVSALFGLAEREARSGELELASRYVALARRVGTRYNVRLLSEYREVYCRSCSSYWVEGRTVRTRLRGGRRTRHCLVCGRTRRTAIRTEAPGTFRPDADRTPVTRVEPTLAEGPSPPGNVGEGEEEEDE